MMIATNALLRSPRRLGRRNGAADAGFTLVEVLIVLAIVALLATVITPQVLRYFGQAKTDTARIQLSAIGSALELYVLDNGSYPSQQAGLAALLRPPADAPRWQGPYLKKAGGLVDPWGRPYQYKIPGRQTPYEIFSLGRDNAVGGAGEDQDIVNW
jgi:general secretion pathway protein G